MFKLSAIVLLVFAVYYTQGLPSQTSKAETMSVTGNKLQLYVTNGTQTENYHLSSVFQNLENEDQTINAQLNAILPFFNFMINPHKDGGVAGCVDELDVQLVYDN